jgi:hypothetical protein
MLAVASSVPEIHEHHFSGSVCVYRMPQHIFDLIDPYDDVRMPTKVTCTFGGIIIRPVLLRTYHLCLGKIIFFKVL